MSVGQVCAKLALATHLSAANVLLMENSLLLMFPNMRSFDSKWLKPALFFLWGLSVALSLETLCAFLAWGEKVTDLAFGPYNSTISSENSKDQLLPSTFCITLVVQLCTYAQSGGRRIDFGQQLNSTLQRKQLQSCNKTWSKIKNITSQLVRGAMT